MAGRKQVHVAVNQTVISQIVERTWLPVTVLGVVSLCYVFVSYLYLVFVAVCFLHIVWVNIRQPDHESTVESTGKSLLITGCDSGLGKAFAIRAHQMGFTVMACCHDDDSEGARDLMRSYAIGMHVIKLDVTQGREVERALKRISKYLGPEGLWAVINAADVLGGGPLELCSMEHFQHVVDVNLLGSVRVTKTFLPFVRLAKGRIINMSRSVSLSNESAYVSSKYGIEAFTESLREELYKFEVQVCLLEVGEMYTHPQVKELGRRLFEEFYSSTEDVQQAYPWDSVERLVNQKHESVKYSQLPTERILELFEGMLLTDSIKHRYIIESKSGMLIRALNKILPGRKRHNLDSRTAK